MENRFIRAEEVADELGVSKPYAYKLIRQLNEELKDKGFIIYPGKLTMVDSFRVGCIGHVSPDQMRQAVAAVGEVLREMEVLDI